MAKHAVFFDEDGKLFEQCRTESCLCKGRYDMSMDCQCHGIGTQYDEAFADWLCQEAIREQPIFRRARRRGITC